jgi:hypothetical protein
VLAAGTVSIILAFLGDALLGLAERAMTPTGLRLAQQAPAALPEPEPAPESGAESVAA